MTGRDLLSFLNTLSDQGLSLDVVATVDLLLDQPLDDPEEIREVIEIDTAEVGGVIGGPSRAIVLRHR